MEQEFEGQFSDESDDEHINVISFNDIDIKIFYQNYEESFSYNQVIKIE